MAGGEADTAPLFCLLLLQQAEGCLRTVACKRNWAFGLERASPPLPKSRTQTASDGGLSDEQLRSYQLEVVQMARTGANLIVVAPTGEWRRAGGSWTLDSAAGRVVPGAAAGAFV